MINYIVSKNKIEASKKAYDVLKENLKENSTLGLATGGTPIDLYSYMIADYENGSISYKNIKSYNLDEYVGLSYDHPESYHKFMDINLFNHIDIDKRNTNIPDGNAEDLEKAISEYQEKLSKTKIDIQILGIGGNGHIGFNEPGTSFDAGVHVVDLKPETIQANARFFDGDINQVPKKAVTMGIADIMKTGLIILLAFGKEKKEAIRKLMTEDVTTDVPCTVLKNHPNVYVFVDEEADYNS